MAPPTLDGRYVRLRPLTRGDAEALLACVLAGDLFRWMPRRVGDLAGMRGYLDEALAAQSGGTALPFVIETRHDDRVVGSTRFHPLVLEHARGEIGWTFLGREVQRTPVNTECKRLLLAYGFDVLNLNRIELKTDRRNTASRAAIARIGGVQEGIFRSHMVVQDGHVRDTVWFSILKSEWPAVRDRLDGWLARPFSFPVTTP